MTHCGHPPCHTHNAGWVVVVHEVCRQGATENGSCENGMTIDTVRVMADFETFKYARCMFGSG